MSAGAADAVAGLVRSHGPRLHAVARRLCGRGGDAEDLVQDVFVQALRKWDTFRGDSDVGTWLYTIAARACRRRRRGRAGGGRREVAMSELMPWGEATVMGIATDAMSAARASERREAIGRVEEAIAALPEHLRVPLVLKDVLELSVEDVALALGLASNTVKTRVHRARLALRKAMTSAGVRVAAPAPIYAKQVCLDLLKAKMDALDGGRPEAARKVPTGALCARCRAVFRELDLVQDACRRMGEGSMPAWLRDRIVRALRERAADDRVRNPTPRRGRRPVAARRS